jgi:hypothetical protein
MTSKKGLRDGEALLRRVYTLGDFLESEILGRDWTLSCSCSKGIALVYMTWVHLSLSLMHRNTFLFSCLQLIGSPWRKEAIIRQPFIQKLPEDCWPRKEHTKEARALYEYRRRSYRQCSQVSFDYLTRFEHFNNSRTCDGSDCTLDVKVVCKGEVKAGQDCARVAR